MGFQCIFELGLLILLLGVVHFLLLGAMEPRKSFWSTLWRFLRFLPYFFGLLVLGIIKGALVCPLACVIMTAGNSAIILALWPAHAIWTYYCIIRTKQLGPVLKFVTCIAVTVLLVLWPLIGIVGSILGGAGYGFFAPLLATFEAVGEGKTDEFIHCIVDGTWSTIQGTFTVIRDLKDICFHSYFSYMDDLRLLDPPNGKPYEIRLLYIPGALLLGLLGVIVNLPIISVIALVKSPYMLFKGWKQLFHDLIGREGPFLETACVPFAGLAILLWPLAVAGAVVASFLSTLVFGGYAAAVTYQESSIKMGLAYIVSSLSIYDEYSNDVLGMHEGSCFPRRPYRKKQLSGATSLSRPASFQQKQDTKKSPARSVSLKNGISELKPFKLLEHLLAECKRHGETLVTEGVITHKDIEDCRSGKGRNAVISIGLPAYCFLQALLRSAKANSDGLLLSDNTEITTGNRPKDTFFDYFFDPLLIMKEQIRVENLTAEEEEYLSKLVLLLSDPERLKTLHGGLPPDNERRLAEINALARRLHGITRSISRYPTMKRRFDEIMKSLSEELEKEMGGGSQSANKYQSTQRIRSGFVRMFSQKSVMNDKSSTEECRVDMEVERQSGNGAVNM